jgi:protein LTV1
LDLEPEVREIFTALDDDAYVEDDLDDDFFSAINADHVPDKYQALLEENEEEELYDDFDDNEESWLKEFKKYGPGDKCTFFNSILSQFHG